MQTDLNKFSSVANNERVLLLSRYSTNCSLTELLELQSPMAEIQSETVSILSFLNGAIQRPLSYEQHIMNQKLTCAKKKFEKSCLLAYRVYCDMELKHNLLVKQYCNDEMILCSKAHDQHGYHCKPSNENHSTFDKPIGAAPQWNFFLGGKGVCLGIKGCNAPQATDFREKRNPPQADIILHSVLLIESKL